MKKSIYFYAKKKEDYVLSDDILKTFNVSVTSDNPTYQPSILHQCYVSELPEGVKFKNDVSLLVHSNALGEKIGVENIKHYLDSIKLPDFSEPDHEYTDEQLMEMARDRRLSTINDRFNYQLVLKNDFESILKDANQRISYDKEQEENKKKLTEILTPKTD